MPTPSESFRHLKSGIIVRRLRSALVVAVPVRAGTVVDCPSGVEPAPIDRTVSENEQDDDEDEESDGSEAANLVVSGLEHATTDSVPDGNALPDEGDYSYMRDLEV